ncbi:MAG: hypothetical protein R6X32_05470 [Chloroflexota bacterium]
MPKSQNISRCFLFVILLGSLFTTVLPQLGINTVFALNASSPPAAAVTDVWQKLQTATSYQFSSDVSQIEIPPLSAANVGMTTNQSHFYALGQVAPPQQQMTMTLWLEGGSVTDPNSGVGVKVADGYTYIRQQDQWEAAGDITQSFAPNSDFAAYLVAAKDVVSEQTVTEDGQAITRYTFAIDGSRFAHYMRDQMEQQERARGKPAFIEVPLSRTYRDMTGSGEVWVDSEGWPIYQQMDLRLPQPSEAQIQVQVSTTFSNFVVEETAVSSTPALSTIINNLTTWSGFLNALQTALPTLLGSVGFGLLMLTVSYASRSRYIYVGLIGGIIFLMLFTPIFQGNAAAAYQEAVVARQTEQEAQQQEQEQVETFVEHLRNDRNAYSGHMLALIRADDGTDSDGDGLTDVQEMMLGSDPFTPSIIGVDVPFAAATLDPTDPTDSDGDGLTDYEEILLGTSSATTDIDGDGVFDGVDTDGDGISDYDEVTTPYEVRDAFGNIRIRYSDPLEPDTNGDGLSDGAQWGPDLDSNGNGIPDLFDMDNDGDGVPDRFDLSPNVNITETFTVEDPFSFKVDGINRGQYTYVEFQLRPTNPDQLWYAFNVFNWPYDDKGNIQNVTGKTFADLPTFDNVAPYNYGNIQIIPMLEIELAASDVDLLPEQAVLDKYGLSLTVGEDKSYIYAPLQLVNDQRSGQRYAFYTKLLYNSELLPQWTSDHQARLAWIVQGLVDRTEIVCDPDDPTDCNQELVEADKLSVLHIYYSDWQLTGMNVRQDLGAEFAFIYQDPFYSETAGNDLPLIQLAGGLDESFMTGRDCVELVDGVCVGNGERDITLDTIVERFDHQNNAGATDIERWNLPDVFRVVKQSYSHIDEAVVKAATEDTQALVLDQFTPYMGITGSHQGTSPLVLFAVEERYRAANLEQMQQDETYYRWENGRLSVDFNAGDAIPELLTVGLNVTPYQYDEATGDWTRHELDTYLDSLEDDWRAELAGDNLTDDELNGYLILTRLYMLALYRGASAVIAYDDVNIGNPRFSLPDTKIADTIATASLASSKWAATKLYNLAGAVSKLPIKEFVGGVGAKLSSALSGSSEKKGVVQSIKQLKVIGELKNLLGKKSINWSRIASGLTLGSLAILAIGVAIVGIALVAASYLLADYLGSTLTQALRTVGAIMIAAAYFFFTVILPVITVVRAVKALVNTGISVARATTSVLLSSSSLIGSAAYVGAIGLVVQLGILYNIFMFTVANGQVQPGTISFNMFLAQTIAAAIVAVLIFLISLTVIGAILLSVLTAIDIFLNLSFGFSITGYLTNMLSKAIYDYQIMVNVESPDLVRSGDLVIHLEDETAGLTDGNVLYFTLPMTTTVRHDKNKADPRTILYYTPDSIRRHTFRHFIDTLTAAQPTIEQTPVEWHVYPYDSKYGRSLYEGQLVQELVSPPQTLQAGLNNRVTLRIGTFYDVPILSCWTVYCEGATLTNPEAKRFTDNHWFSPRLC